MAFHLGMSNVRSASNAWLAVRKKIEEIQTSATGVAPAPTATAAATPLGVTPKKRGATGSAAKRKKSTPATPDIGEEADDEPMPDTPTPTPSKRQRTNHATTAARGRGRGRTPKANVPGSMMTMVANADSSPDLGCVAEETIEVVHEQPVRGRRGARGHAGTTALAATKSALPAVGSFVAPSTAVAIKAESMGDTGNAADMAYIPMQYKTEDGQEDGQEDGGDTTEEEAEQQLKMEAEAAVAAAAVVVSPRQATLEEGEI